MNEERFKCELNGLDWPNILRINNDNVDLSFDLFYENVKKLILKHAPLKKLTIQEKKLRLKPWITTGILTSIKTKKEFTENSYVQQMLLQNNNYMTTSNIIEIT